MMVPLKRRKVVSSHTESCDGDEIKFPLVVLFLLERKMGTSRRSFLSQLGRKKGFQVEEKFSESVTHIISENNSGSEVRTWLNSQVKGQTPSVHLLDISWFTESMKAGHPVQILDRHKLQEQQITEAEVKVFSVPSYACQRRTTLENHNSVLTDALSLLAESAELSEEEGRGVAFRRAAAVLKSLPEQVTSMKQLRGLPCLGDHSLRVIKDVLENGASSEVESTKQSERYKAMKKYDQLFVQFVSLAPPSGRSVVMISSQDSLSTNPIKEQKQVLTGIFGVGSKTADRWIRERILNLQQLRDSGQTLNRAQQAGVEHYDDLNQPVTKAEADTISEIVQRAVVSVLPGARMTLIGGFRRGKQTGHDVDFLITHPEEGREEGLMPKVVSCLDAQGFLLYQKTTRNSYLEAQGGPGRPSSNMDRFERCFSIFKLHREDEHGAKQGAADPLACFHTLSQKGSHEASDEGVGEEKACTHRRWRAVRVDLVVSPISQFAFALLGWTGSKLFERELRRWAGHEKSMSLSSHALFDSKQGRYLRATSEEEIFAHLGLEFIPPSERNA